MSPVKIKICGLSRSVDIAVANALQPDYVGFVFAPGSKRYVSPETAAKLRRQLDERIPAVGVFVNYPPEKVAALLVSGTIQYAQLHGQETESYIGALRELTDAPILQAFRIKTAHDLLRAEQSSADHILLDNGAGGTGERFDWSILPQIRRPFFLAGGLNPGNVTEAITLCRPMAVDVSSGVETEGVKDPEKMEQFVRNVRSCLF